MNLAVFSVNLPWRFFDILNNFKMAAFIVLERVTSSDF